LCQNQQGYLNLSELISLSYLKGEGMEGASISAEQLIQHNQGLILIAPAVRSDVAQALIENQIPKAKEKVMLN
jgi:DNA polymerase-3 subunit alpha